MNYFLALMIVLILSIGNFFPLVSDDVLSIVIKIFVLFFSCFLFFVLNNRILLKIRLIIYFYILTIFFLISSFNSQDFIYAIDKYLSISFSVVFCLFLFEKIIDRVGFDNAVQYLIKIGFSFLVITIVYKIIFGFWDRTVRFFLNGPIVFGWMMAMYSLLSLYIYKKNNNYMYLLLFLLFFIAIIWTESKGPLISYIVAVSFYLSYSSKIYIKIPLLIFSCFIFYFRDSILNYLNDYLMNTRLSAIIRLLSSDVSSQDEGSITIRQDMLIESINLILNNWMFGIGLGNYQFQTIYGFIYPHNIHIEIFLECGFFIGSIYVIFVLLSLYYSPNVIKALIIMFIICSSFSGDITYLRFLLFMCMIGIILEDKIKSISK